MISRGRRYRKVFSILARHGFDDVLASLSGNRLVRFFRRRVTDRAQFNRERWVRLRLALEELGPTYVKFGQVLSNRPGLLPDDLTAELAKLQDAVPPFPFEEVERLFLAEFGKPVQQVFSSFDPVQLASASIAQVHRAVLFSGEKVAVKIQRPGIEAVIRADVEILRDIAALMAHSEEFAALQPRQLVDVFERSILSELSFTTELHHLKWFRDRFAGDKTVKIPAVYKEFSGRKVITLEFIEGIKIKHTDRLRQEGYDLKLLAQRGFEAYFKQIFEWGCFHADPHPGNLLVLPGNVLAILDFGMIGKLNGRDRQAVNEFIIGLGRDDTSRIVENIEKLQGMPVEDQPALEKDIELFIQEFGNQAVKDINLNDAISRGRLLISKHRLQLNPDLFLLLRTVSLLEGIGMSLDPEFRSLDMVKPYALRLIRKNLRLQNILRSRTLLASLADLARLAVQLPGQARRVLDKAVNGELKIQVEDQATNRLTRELNHTGKRVSYVLLTALFFFGGCFFLTRNIHEIVWGMNMASLLSFALSLLMLWCFFRVK